MSRIGKKPILIPNAVKVSLDGAKVSVTGPRGTLSFVLLPEIAARMVKEQDTNNEILTVDVKTQTKKSSAYLGMSRSILESMVKGVTEGFEKKLELVGVGYRAKMVGSDTVSLSLGFSHPVEFKIPQGITAEVTDNTNITIKGFDKYLVGQVAANIRKIRKPEPYKGKGIKYAGEFVRRKQGKSGKV